MPGVVAASIAWKGRNGRQRNVISIHCRSSDHSSSSPYTWRVLSEHIIKHKTLLRPQFSNWSMSPEGKARKTDGRVIGIPKSGQSGPMCAMTCPHRNETTHAATINTTNTQILKLSPLHDLNRNINTLHTEAQTTPSTSPFRDRPAYTRPSPGPLGTRRMRSRTIRRLDPFFNTAAGLEHGRLRKRWLALGVL